MCLSLSLSLTHTHTHIYIYIIIYFILFLYLCHFVSLSLSPIAPNIPVPPLLIYNALYVLYLILSLYHCCLFPILPYYQQIVKVSNNQILYILSLYKSQLIVKCFSKNYIYNSHLTFSTQTLPLINCTQKKKNL